MIQHTHHSSNFTTKKFPITVLCENVSNASNIGSLFRICDAFGIEEIIFCGDKEEIISRKMRKTARSTFKYVTFKVISSIESVLPNFLKSHQCIALEITNTSTPVHLTKFDDLKPILLIIGDENMGVSNPVLEKVHMTHHIEMFGENSSMNVVQATNIALYEITKQLV